jgi:hypothetical protein
MQYLWETVGRTFLRFGDRLSAFGPNLLAMLVILLTGIVLAAAASFVLRRALPRIGFDVFAERSGLASLLRKGGVAISASAVVALLAAWALIAVFTLLAISALDMRVGMDFVSRAFAYLPQLLIAMMLVVFGSLLAGILRRSVLIAAVNAGLPSARLLAGGVQTALTILFLAMALEHLGVGRQVLLASFTIVFGGVVFALSLAFGLGGRHLAREVLERLSRRPRDKEQDEIRHV